MAISDRITSIEEHIKESYQELEGIGIDTTGVNNNLENIPKLIDEYWETLPKVTGEGTSITLDNTKEGKMKINLKGNTSQEGTPTPENPQEVHVVSGDNTIKVEGKNLFDEETILKSSNFTYSNGYYTGLSNDLRSYMSSNRNIIKFKANTQYTISLTGYVGTATNVRIRFIYTDLEWSETTYLASSTPTQVSGTSTAGKTIDYIILNYSQAGTIFIKDFQVEESATATSYEPYQSQSYVVNLGTIELCKIGDYQDYIYKEGKKWYKYGAIGKVVLNGSESGWVNDGGSAPYKYVISDIKNPTSNAYTEVFCNNYYPIPYNDNWNNYDYLITRPQYTSTTQGVKFKNKDISGLNDFKTWLGTHNTIVYYVLATPTYTKIEGTLESQLNALAKSYASQTNISQENNDLASLLNANALEEM